MLLYSGDTVVSNTGTPSSGSSPSSVTVTTSGSSPLSGPSAPDAAVQSSVLPSQSATPKRQTLKELLASIPGFSLRVSHCYMQSARIATQTSFVYARMTRSCFRYDFANFTGGCYVHR